MSEAYRKGEPTREPMTHRSLGGAIEQLQKDFAQGADEGRIKQFKSEASLKDYKEKREQASNPRPLITMEMLNDKIEALSAKIDQIFGNAVLINGKWTNVNI